MPLVLIPLLLLALCAPASASGLAGRISHVISGRQLVLITPAQGLFPLRLQGIQLKKEDPQLLRAAKRRLNGLIGGRFVRFETSGTKEEGELLGFVDYSGQEINLTLIADGLATVVPDQLDVRRRSLYEEAQQEARQRQLGIWQRRDTERTLTPQ